MSTDNFMRNAIKAAQKSLKKDTGQELAIVMTVGTFEQPASIANFISNAERPAAIKMLRATADRLEAKT